MKVLLSFSKHHFDPINLIDPETSSGLIAKQIYDYYIKLYGNENVYYIDPEDFDFAKIKSTKFDKFIGLDVNFVSLAKKIKARENILVAVNQHPAFRRKIISNLLKSTHNPKALHSSDGIYSLSKQSNFADKILVIGNDVTLNTYRKIYGNQKCLVSSIYEVPILEVSTIANPNLIIAYIGSLNYRKCIDIYLKIIQSNVLNRNFKFLIVGSAVNDYWQNKINQLSNFSNVEFIERLSPSSSCLLELLSRTKFALFLTREEGLSGSYLLLSNAKIPVLTSKYVGVNPIGELDFEVEKNVTVGINKIKKLVETSDSDFNLLKPKFHNYFEKTLRSNNSLQDSLTILDGAGLKKSKSDKFLFNLRILKVIYLDLFSFTYIRSLSWGYYIYYKQKLFFKISLLRNL